MKDTKYMVGNYIKFNISHRNHETKEIFVTNNIGILTHIENDKYGVGYNEYTLKDVICIEDGILAFKEFQISGNKSWLASEEEISVYNKWKEVLNDDIG